MLIEIQIFSCNRMGCSSENKREKQRWNYSNKYKPPYDTENVILHIDGLL